jgi:hypothetical protein
MTDLRAAMTEAAKDAFADDVRDGTRLVSDDRLRRPWRALDDALDAAWRIVSPHLAETPAGATTAPADPATDRRDRMAEALRENWSALPDWDLQAAARTALAALPELADYDRLVVALAELADDWARLSREQLARSAHWHTAGDDATARVARVRGEMWRVAAARLRALLEDM